jgi:hypothetical protein
MELNSGDDPISLTESIPSRSSPPIQSPLPCTADEYGRCNGLTVDSRLLDWRHLVEHDDGLAATLTDLEFGQLIEGTPLEECIFRAIIPTTEQWQMPATALQVLQRTCRRSSEGEVADLLSQQCLPETLQWKDLKLEVPALRSDHGTDCRRLARRVKAFLKEPLPDHRLPLHPVDAEKGEGVEIPGGMLEKDRERMRAIEDENLVVAKDTLVYLMQSLKTEIAENARKDFTLSMSDYHGVSGPPPTARLGTDTLTIARSQGAPDATVKPTGFPSARVLRPSSRSLRASPAVRPKLDAQRRYRSRREQNIRERVPILGRHA